MPLGVHGWELVAALTIVLLGGMVQGAIGFGLNLICVPVLAILVPGSIPGSMVVISMPMTLTMLLREHHAIDWPGVRWIAFGHLPGTLVGAAVVVAVPNAELAIVVGVVILLGVVLSWLHPGIPVNRGTGTSAGVIAGITGTAAGVDGPRPCVAVPTPGAAHPASDRLGLRRDRGFPGDCARADRDLTFAGSPSHPTVDTLGEPQLPSALAGIGETGDHATYSMGADVLVAHGRALVALLTLPNATDGWRRTRGPVSTRCTQCDREENYSASAGWASAPWTSSAAASRSRSSTSSSGKISLRIFSLISTIMSTFSDRKFFAFSRP